MNIALVLLAVVGCALAQVPVQVADAPDVAAAKAHFFAIQAAETHRNLAGHHYGYGHHGYAHLGYPYLGYGLAHHGVHKRSAQVADAPDVAAAKAHFFAIQKAETHRNLAGHHYGYAHHGYAHLGYPHLGYGYGLAHHGVHKRSAQAPEPVQDTPEVAAAKAHFSALYNEAAARADAAPERYPYQDVVGNAYYGPYGYAHHGYAHLGYPYLGYGHGLAHHGIHKRQAPAPVEDTPEVAAAKAHLAVIQKAQGDAAAAAPDFDLDGAISTHDGHLTAYQGQYGYGHYGYAGHLGYAPYGVAPYGVAPYVLAHHG